MTAEVGISYCSGRRGTPATSDLPVPTFPSVDLNKHGSMGWELVGIVPIVNCIWRSIQRFHLRIALLLQAAFGQRLTNAVAAAQAYGRASALALGGEAGDPSVVQGQGDLVGYQIASWPRGVRPWTFAITLTPRHCHGPYLWAWRDRGRGGIRPAAPRARTVPVATLALSPSGRPPRGVICMSSTSPMRKVMVSSSSRLEIRGKQLQAYKRRRRR